MQKSLVLVVLWENKGDRTVFNEGKCVNRRAATLGGKLSSLKVDAIVHPYLLPVYSCG